MRCPTASRPPSARPPSPRAPRGYRRGRATTSSAGAPPRRRGRGRPVTSRPPKMLRTRPALASASVDTSVAIRRRPGSPRSTEATPNRSSPSAAASVPPAPSTDSQPVDQVGPGAGRGTWHGHQLDSRARWSGTPRASPGRRGTGPRPAWSGRRPRRLSPTTRPAREMASVPTSARSDVTACCALRGDLGLAALDDARRLGLGLLPHLRDDRRPVLARLLTDPRRLVPGVGELLSELGELGVGLGLLGLGRGPGHPRSRRVRSVNVASKLRRDELLDEQEQQPEHDERGSTISTGCGTSGLIPASAARGIKVCMCRSFFRSRRERWVTGQSTNASGDTDDAQAPRRARSRGSRSSGGGPGPRAGARRR